MNEHGHHHGKDAELDQAGGQPTPSELPARRTLTIDDYDQDIHAWIEQNLVTQARLDDLAAALGYSKRTVQLHFKKKYGMTIGEYILTRRLHMACLFLRMTTLSVSEIAYRLHFQNHNNFCRAFKKRLNYTPLAYRALPLSLLPLRPVQLPQTNHLEPIDYQIVTLENKVLVGAPFRYQDKFTDANSIGGEIRLQRLRGWFLDNRAALTIASDICLNDVTSRASRNELITVTSIAGHTMNVTQGMEVPENTTVYPLDGLYLRCPFWGFFSDYASHNKDIYRHLLPKLGLKRRDGRDLEFFYFTRHIFDAHPMVSCEHYIPILDEHAP